MARKRFHAFLINWSVIVSLVVGSQQGKAAVSPAPTNQDFKLVTILAEEIADWVRDLENTPSSIAIYSVNTHQPLDSNLANVLEVELMQALLDKGIRRITSCYECRTPNVSIRQGEIVISKGAPDIKSMLRVAKVLPARSLMVVEVYKTEMDIVGQVSLYENPTGAVLGTKRFEIPKMDVAKTSVQFIIRLGSGSPVVTNEAGDSEGLKGSFGLSLLEEIGFGKGGLTLGTVLAPAGLLIFLNPTLGLRGNIGASKMGYGLNFGLGYGISGSYRGIVTSLSAQVYVVSWAAVGIDGVYFFPSDTPTTETVSGYVGVHIGLVLGR